MSLHIIAMRIFLDGSGFKMELQSGYFLIPSWRNGGSNCQGRKIFETIKHNKSSQNELAYTQQWKLSVCPPCMFCTYLEAPSGHRVKTKKNIYIGPMPGTRPPNTRLCSQLSKLRSHLLATCLSWSDLRRKILIDSWYFLAHNFAAHLSG